MDKIVHIQGIVAPLNRANVDTDAIMPKQFLKSIKRTGFGDFVFDEWRYEDHGEPGMDCRQRPLKKDFSLNQARYQGAKILLTQSNFGCGSSREHAPWGLKEYGFDVIIAPSFAEIFFNNCSKNGILPITLPQTMVDKLFVELEKTPGYQLTIDLPNQQITTAEGEKIAFDIDSFVKTRLLEGLDDIALTLQHQDKIKAFEKQQQQRMPWLYD